MTGVDSKIAYRKEMARFDTGKLVGSNKGRGHNQTTASGNPYYCFDPQPEEIHITDIAAQLARICRFNGALRDDIGHYSVAQHCCLVSDHCPPELALEGLLHDAHEAYIGDMSKPVKMNLHLLSGKQARDWWKVLEHHNELAVRRRFGLPNHMAPAVKEQDYLAVTTEHRDLQVHTGLVDWGNMPTPWPETIQPWNSFRARSEFLRRFYALYNGDCHDDR